MRHHLTSIVAIDRRGAIGCKNRLPWSIKSDMAFFRKTTTNHTVVMGRKTYESIGGPLKGRKNLVLSHNSVLFASTEICTLVNSVDEAMAKALSATETFVVGGAATYAEFAPFVDRYLVTIVDHQADDADAFLSSEIMAEYASWEAQEIDRRPMEPGRDEFAFRIVAFSAPDAAERREKRKALANQHLGKRMNLASKRHSTAKRTDGRVQTAFSF